MMNQKTAKITYDCKCSPLECPPSPTLEKSAKILKCGNNSNRDDDYDGNMNSSDDDDEARPSGSLELRIPNISMFTDQVF
ncbi:unnamed protein product [Protopolystoma xenopodis]|uniref:Uncharacterized protein n=1 Tax=Protopolystoma xenopodis TaxID=117903 RepID=A0A448WY85_9PLAT|nr:unnamed protein product [Protopolystoma xenopodis]